MRMRTWMSEGGVAEVEGLTAGENVYFLHGFPTERR
jgi:hypothetical protein